MKRLRVALIGTGKAGDAFRAALPTYGVVDVDYAGGTITVDVPDECVPPVLLLEPVTTTNDAKNGTLVTGLTALQKAKTSAFYDARYEEHAGKFLVDAK